MAAQAGCKISILCDRRPKSNQVALANPHGLEAVSNDIPEPKAKTTALNTQNQPWTCLCSNRRNMNDAIIRPQNQPDKASPIRRRLPQTPIRARNLDASKNNVIAELQNSAKSAGTEMKAVRTVQPQRSKKSPGIKKSGMRWLALPLSLQRLWLECRLCGHCGILWPHLGWCSRIDCRRRYCGAIASVE